LQLFGGSGLGAVQDHHPALGCFDEYVDSFIEFLRVLNQIDLFWRQVVPYLNGMRGCRKATR